STSRRSTSGSIVSSVSSARGRGGASPRPATTARRGLPCRRRADRIVGGRRRIVAHVELLNVSKRYGNTVAVNDVTIQISEGEFFSLLGPSGCGKTTTLRMVAGF